MSPVEPTRQFVSRRLSAAAGEIFTVFLPTLVQFQEQIQTLKRLLEISRRETTKPQRTERLQQHLCRKEQLWKQQQNSSLDQEEAEPQHIKDELPGDHQEADTIMVTVVDEQSDSRENLDSPNSMKKFINQRLTAAAGEIYSEFQQTIIRYQEEIQTQQKLLEITLIPQVKLHKIDNQEQQTNSDWELEEPDTFQIKEELEEPEASRIEELLETESIQIKEEETEYYSSHDEDQHVMKEEADYFLIIPNYEGSQPTDPEPDRDMLLFQDSVVAGSQHHKSINLGDSGSTTKAGSKFLKRCVSKNGENSPFSPQSSLSANREAHTVKKTHTCEICGKNFQSPSHLLRHMRIHTGEKPHSCETCGKCFRVKSSLSVHMRIHSGEKPYSCETCGKSFNQNSNLWLHMKTHTGVKPHSCETCGKCFTYRGDLLRHMRIHTGEKPHSCATCGKSFSQNSNLLSHMRTHTDEKPSTSTKM